MTNFCVTIQFLAATSLRWQQYMTLMDWCTAYSISTAIIIIGRPWHSALLCSIMFLSSAQKQPISTSTNQWVMVMTSIRLHWSKCCNFLFIYKYLTKPFLLCLMLSKTYYTQNYELGLSLIIGNVLYRIASAKFWRGEILTFLTLSS